MTDCNSVELVDLIDLNVPSPTPPALGEATDCCSYFCDPYLLSGNLLDSSLPSFEYSLQSTSTSSPLNSTPLTESLSDHNHVLIDICDDCNEHSVLRRTQSASELGQLLEFENDDGRSATPRSCSCDNLEALAVLRSLDEILDNEEARQSIEECLSDLDQYLDQQDNDDDDQILRDQLHHFEQNYAKFVSYCNGNHALCGSLNSLRGFTADDGTFNRLNRLRTSAPSSALFSAHSHTTTSRIIHGLSRDCQTGSVVVEALPTLRPLAAKNLWIRSSMRRLRQVPMPLEFERPTSAPSRLSINRSEILGSMGTNTIHQSGYDISSRPSSSMSSQSRHAASLHSSATSLASTINNMPIPRALSRSSEGQRTRGCDPLNIATPAQPHITLNANMPASESPLGHWPNSFSSALACLGCTLGLFNICRFATLSCHFGANFIFQFLLLSLVFGLPLFSLELCLGQQLGAGVVDMWKISPLFQGIGVALLVAQAVIGLYTIVGVSWMFVFFRDSFITNVDRYRWTEPFSYYREGVSIATNSTRKLSETIPDYFSGVVLQRHHLSTGTAYSTVKFQLAFNLAVVWMIVFVCLSKGLRSYGKVVYVFSLVPVMGMFVLCAKLLGLMPAQYATIIFPETSWSEFFLNTKSWYAAAQETFLTWGLLSASVMQIASHNKHKHLLQRDSSLVVFMTFVILLMVAFLANTCVHVLKTAGYNYFPSSYERISTYTFLRSTKEALPPSLASIPVRYMNHNSFILGESILKPSTDRSQESSYQALRFATELIPATLAVMGAQRVSPFWAVLFYFVLILFGIAQQLAIWHSVITGVIAIKSNMLQSWETTITLFSCACGFVLGLPLATELGIYIVYFMDYTVGGVWWLILIVLMQIVVLFMVRGRPYSGDTVVTALFTPKSHPCVLGWAPVLLSFTWNVILPVALMVLCITIFRNGNYRDLFVWHQATSPKYWPIWVRQIGVTFQLVPLALILVMAIVQCYRYLNRGPADILDRIQLLYRPPIGEHMADLRVHDVLATTINAGLGSGALGATLPNGRAMTGGEDPPPKYTPPPSYTTATGARIAKFLRQSFRRSVRRLAGMLGESSGTQRFSDVPNIQLAIQPSEYRGTAADVTDAPNVPSQPPDYSAVLVEMSEPLNTLERLRRIHPVPGSPTLTAAEVASILRSSFRRQQSIRRIISNSNRSAENLVESAEPIGETSLVGSVTTVISEDGHQMVNDHQMPTSTTIERTE